MKNIYLIVTGILLAAYLIILPVMQISFAHQRALFEINDKDYLFVIGSANEPLYVDDKTAVVLNAYWPNASDPTDTQANGTHPIIGLENTLKAEVLAGDKNFTSNLVPAFGELGSYESNTFYPTIPTTYSYRILGEINGTDFDVTFSCNPAAGEAAPSDNSTMTISYRLYDLQTRTM